MFQKLTQAHIPNASDELVMQAYCFPKHAKQDSLHKNE